MSSNIDKIVYINLEKRLDRRNHIEKTLNNYSLISKSVRFQGFEYPPGKGIVGCGYSHLAVLKMAKAKKWKNVLILEDDFEFLVSPEEFEKELEYLFNSNLEFDVCMLSYNLHESSPIDDNIFRIKYAQTASAYIVKQHYYDKIIKLYQKNIPILEATGTHWIYANDVCWRTLQEKDQWIGFTKRIGKQLDGYSDNANCVVQYNC